MELVSLGKNDHGRAPFFRIREQFYITAAEVICRNHADLATTHGIRAEVDELFEQGSIDVDAGIIGFAVGLLGLEGRDPQFRHQDNQTAIAARNESARIIKTIIPDRNISTII